MIYEKPRAELFAQDAPESEIKPFTAWLRGLGIAFDETNGYPEMESFNGLLQALNSYIKYLEQNGFAEWSADLEYPIGAGVRVGNVWYKAKQQNTNKPPSTSQSDWSVFLNAGDLSYADPLQNVDGQIQIKDATTTQKGVARFASATEVANKSNVSAAITPKNVADMFVGNFSQNGSLTLPSGHILKWGVVDYSSKPNEGDISVSFPSSFPTACIFASATRKVTASSGQNNDGGVHIISFTNMVLSVNLAEYTVSNSGLRGFTWFAIGY